MNETLLIVAVHQQELTEQAQKAEESLKRSHAELRSHTEELARFNRAAVGRESRMIELKQEVNELLRRQGATARYPLEFEQDVEPDKLPVPPTAPDERLVSLEAVLCTEELARRPGRLPDYETENRALTVLTQVLADAPHTILQTLADKALEVFQADSVGLSLLTKDEKRFYWPAIAGVWKPHIGKGTPRDFGTCGDVLDCNAALLFTHPERRYHYLLPVTPAIEECLLVPFYVGGKAVGTLWAIFHAAPSSSQRKRRRFDAEDLRLMQSLARCASSAYRQETEFLDAVEQRHAALNLLEDAVQMHEALRDSEVRYRRLFESSREGILILDADRSEIADVNPCLAEMLGYPCEEFIGKQLWQIGLLQDARQSRAMVGELMEKGYARYENLPLETRAGRQVEVEVIASVYQENRRPVIQCTVREITARRLLENQALEQASSLADLHRRKDEFLAMLSHELRNPLTSLHIAVYLLGDPDGSGVTHTEMCGLIERQVDQLTRLVDDLLEVARFTTGKIRLKETRVDLRDVVEGAVAASRLQCDQKSQTINTALPTKPIWIYGDPLRLEQVVVNLLNNAHKYTDRNGLISVDLERLEDEAVLRVRDNGIGISPEMLPTIFELFTQADRSLNCSQGGMGIGLSLVRSLVDMHRGTIEVRSTLGQSSEFIVKLPVASAAPSPETVSA